MRFTSTKIEGEDINSTLVLRRVSGASKIMAVNLAKTELKE